MIRDKQGRIVWQLVPPPGQKVSDFQMQTYDGRPMLTWTQGHGMKGDLQEIIADDHYQVVKTVRLPDGLSTNLHEFRLIPGDRALMIATKVVPADLTGVGGPRDGLVADDVALVVDISTNTIVGQWDALAHVPLTDSYIEPDVKISQESSSVFDAYHMNSVALDPEGNLLISMRHTSTVYDVDPVTGVVNWQLGGRRSSFDSEPGVQFAFQHDAQMPDATTLRLFNNNANGKDALGHPASMDTSGLR